MNFSRRVFLGAAGALGGCCYFRHPGSDSSTQDDWQYAQTLAKSVVPPDFRENRYPITAFGAATGLQDNTHAIKQAIGQCHAEGGGHVVVPEGVFHTGAIQLLSGVNLHLDAGAVLRFHTEPRHYLPEVFTRWEGMEMMGYSPLVYAYGQTDIGVSGEGVLDGQADATHWWAWKGNEEWGVPGYPSQFSGRQQLMADVAAGVPPKKRQYGRGFYFRPPFVQFYSCERVLLEDFKIVRSPFWLINPVLCTDVIVRGVTLESLGPNSDGCNPESCQKVLIENCFFNTGDDCIAIKSGRNADGRRIAVPSKDIVIRNCQMRAGHGGVVLGSEISGGANHIFVENCTMSSPDLERGIRIKTNSVRGGHIHHLRFRNITIGEVKDAIVINFYYEEGDAGDFIPTVEDIQIDNLVCHKAQRAFVISGFPRSPIRGLVLRGCHFQQSAALGELKHVVGLTLADTTVNGKVLRLPDGQ